MRLKKKGDGAESALEDISVDRNHKVRSLNQYGIKPCAYRGTQLIFQLRCILYGIRSRMVTVVKRLLERLELAQSGQNRQISQVVVYGRMTVIRMVRGRRSEKVDNNEGGMKAM